MPRGVYSTRFVAGQVSSTASGLAAAYTVPADKVAVVKSIDYYCSAAGSVFVCLQVGANNFAIISTEKSTVGQDRHWQGAQVFNAGDKINPIWVSGNFALTISGFLLNAVP